MELRYSKKSNNHTDIQTVRTGGINDEAGEVDELFFIYSKYQFFLESHKMFTDGGPS